MGSTGQDPWWRWLGVPALALILVLAIIGDGYLLHASQTAGSVSTAASASGASSPAATSEPPFAATPLAPAVVVTAVASAATPVQTPRPATGEATATAEAGAPISTPQVVTAPAPPHALRIETATTTGKALCNEAAAENGQSLYVTDDGSEQLLVFDVTTRRVTRSFDLTDSLCSLALDTAGQTIYIPTWRRKASGGFDSSEIQALNLATGALSRFPATLFPTGPFFDPASRMLYAANTATSSLVALNTATGRATDSVAIPAKVNRVATSAANGYLYMASPEANKVYVLDVKSRRVVATLDVGTRPWDVAADPRTGRIFVSAELSGSVTILDPQYNETLRVIKVGSHPRNLAIDPLHGMVYVLNAGDHTVSSFDTDGAALQTSAPLPGTDDVTGLAVAPKTGQVFVVSKQQIYVLQ